MQATPAQAEEPEDEYCAYDVDEDVEACFPTFAESLEWVGFDDVPSELTAEEYFSEAYAPTGTESLMAESMAASFPPGFAYASQRMAGGSEQVRVYWGSDPNCASTWDSLVNSAWNNKTVQVTHGICGQIKTFASWDPNNTKACLTSSALSSHVGSWGTSHWLVEPALHHVSCFGYAS